MSAVGFLKKKCPMKVFRKKVYWRFLDKNVRCRFLEKMSAEDF
jgi:phage FluMu protein Com